MRCVRQDRLVIVITVSTLVLSLALTLTKPAAALSPPSATQPGLSLTVLSPNGKPAVGALAVLVPPGHSADVTDGRKFDDDPDYVRATADEAGHLHFANPPDLFLLVVIHDTGSLELNQDAVRGDGRFTLTAWGSVRGRRFIGDKPAVGRKIAVWADRSGGTTSQFDPRSPTTTFISNVIVDAGGNYQVDRISPGEAYVAVGDATNWAAPLDRPMHIVNVQAAATTTLDIGGKGRAVVGRVVLPPELTNRHDWEYWLCMALPKPDAAESPMPKELQYQPLTKQIQWWKAFNQTPEATKRSAVKQERYERVWAGTYPFDIQTDGTFRIEDVEPGAYKITFEVRTRKAGANPRTELADGEAEFTIDAMAGGRTDEPLQLPPIVVEAVRDVRVGDVAPDFTVMGFDDQPLQLSKFRGKYVLLEFWATWCGPCIAEMENVKAVHDKFGADERFTMISLSADESPDLPEQFVAAHGLAWHQGFMAGASAWDQPIENLYAVKSIPSIWLIGPDGKVIRKNLGGEELMTEVGKVLSR